MPPERDPVRLISRILLQQEEAICHLRHEKCFVMFMKHDQEGILRQLMMVAKEWNDKKAKTPEQLESPLRTLLLQSMLQELLNRVQKESSTEEGRARLVQKGWLTPEHHWAYLSLGPSGQAANPGHQAAHPACGPHPNTYVDAARAPRRDHPDLQIGATDAQDRSAGPPGHYLQTRSVTPGPNIAGDARGIRQAGCVLRDTFDRSLHQAGQPAPIPAGSTACRPDLPPSVKPQAPTETQVRVGSPPAPTDMPQD